MPHFNFLFLYKGINLPIPSSITCHKRGLSLEKKFWPKKHPSKILFLQVHHWAFGLCRKSCSPYIANYFITLLCTTLFLFFPFFCLVLMHGNFRFWNMGNLDFNFLSQRGLSSNLWVCSIFFLFFYSALSTFFYWPWPWYWWLFIIISSFIIMLNPSSQWLWWTHRKGIFRG